MSERLDELLIATWEDPVFGDTFEKDDPDRLDRVRRQMGAVARTATERFTSHVSEGMRELNEDDIHTLLTEILSKTLAFGPALLEAHIDDIPRLSAEAVAVSIMYLCNQNIGRNDRASEAACMVFADPDLYDSLTPTEQLRYLMYRHITDHIKVVARPEDVPYVLPRFYEDVLVNDVRAQQLSRDYLASGRDDDFLGLHARELAEIATIDAGFPSITASLYALLRQHDDSLPRLAEIDANATIRDTLQVCNVIARLLDDIGDWRTDAGDIPGKGEFVINPYSEYHPAFIGRFCELAFMDEHQTASLQYAFEHFQDSPDAHQEHGAYIIETLRLHARTYIANLPAEITHQYATYIDLCKRVLTISYVNRIGDIALAE